ncbi:MAG: hypothetical protein PHS53_02085 [Candidatus Pacebacteria bacterium]|nr:hypothetical protein [Candidatus Paceibacterota bacterium]MDD5356914.1 hypothetical protein [Candidatus Paceibacterota bacterium]
MPVDKAKLEREILAALLFNRCMMTEGALRQKLGTSIPLPDLLEVKQDLIERGLIEEDLGGRSPTLILLDGK